MPHPTLTIGVLQVTLHSLTLSHRSLDPLPPHSALQGSYSEHLAVLASLPFPLSLVAVRTPAELAQCDGLIIPGGESTTMSLVAQSGGLISPLRDFVRAARDGNGSSPKSVWGTCAGMILLGKDVVGGKDGYEGLDGVDCRVVRNQWGRQVSPFPPRRPHHAVAH